MPMSSRTAEMPKPAVAAVRILVAFWLLGWYIKGVFFQQYLFSTIVNYPLRFDLFPPFFESSYVAQFFYVFPLFAVLVFVRSYKFYFYIAAFAMTLSSAVLLLHQDTYNDATFVTSFWVGLWFFWFITQLHRN